MKTIVKFYGLAFFLSLSIICQAQLENKGAIITIQAGTTVYVKMDVDNHSSASATGVINIEGTLNVEGDLTNTASLTTSSGSLLRFSGNANSNFTSNGAIIENLELAKDDAANGSVSIIDSLHIKTNLNFVTSANANKLILGSKDLILTQEGTTITNADAKNYILADGSGMLEKTATANASFIFPVGDVSDYSPLSTNYTASVYTAAKIRVNVKPLVHPNKPVDAESYLERYWTINQSGISDYNNNLIGTYVASDIAAGSTESLIKGTTYHNSEWDYVNADRTASNVHATTSDSEVDFTGTNFFGKLDLKVFLQGAYNSGTAMMSTTLSGLAAFPLTSPYAADPVTVTSVPADVTDWVLVELRDPGTPSTVLSSHSAFLKKDGTIISTDGSAKVKMKEPADNSPIVAISHRNHLSVRTSIGLDLANPALFEFNVGTNVYTNGALSNTNMKDVSGTYVLWGGNVNGNGNVRYNGPANDQASLLGTILGGNTGTVIGAVYSNGDLNMNGNVRYNGPANDQAYLLGNVLGGNTGTVITKHQ